MNDTSDKPLPATPTNVLNREAWLQAATEALRPLFRGAGFEVPPIAVSVGWPSRGATSNSKRVLGQCWFGSMTENNVPQLFISPLIDDPTAPDGVLGILVHEICHVIAGAEAKHGPKFVKVMKKVFLEGKPTSTVASADLVERFKQMMEKLGPFPHSKIVLSDAEKKKQTTRMIKCQCGECEYVVRTVRKWLDLYGAPICPKDKVQMKYEGAPEAEDPDNE